MTGRGIAQSITVRMSVLFAAASALVLTGIGVLLYEALDDSLTTRQQRPLMALSTVLQHMMDDLADVPSLEYLGEQPGIVGHLLDSHPAMSLWIYGEDGRNLFASSRTVVPKEEWESLAAPEARQVTMGLWQPAGQSAYRLAVARFSSKRAEIGRGFIVLAMDVSEPLRILKIFRRSVLIAVPVAVLIVGLIGVFIARGVLRPLARVAESARRVTASQLNERLDLTDVPSELQDLANSFNTMLARLEDSFRRISDFSADLAHELRTPLTSLLGRTRLVLSKRRSADEYREALELSVGEIERLSALVSDMLFLAQADRAPAGLAYDRVDLRDQVNRLIEFFGMAAEERQIALEARGHAMVFADRAMLGRALTNLLSNAIRHSPDGERVDVVIERGKSAVTVSVVDRGPGLSPADASRVFDRFYRTDPSRARHSGGTGLGLAIARSIMKMHGGDVSVKSEPGKSTVFTLSIPERAPEVETPPTTPAGTRGPAWPHAAPENPFTSPPR
ncbi:MAG: heavy metal sensor histidine kinase [Betaproteobacteria bacterium]|nr:heavy metal sensor histidine kinase [Betaproteobacteria bacterium]